MPLSYSLFSFMRRVTWLLKCSKCPTVHAPSKMQVCSGPPRRGAGSPSAPGAPSVQGRWPSAALTDCSDQREEAVDGSKANPARPHCCELSAGRFCPRRGGVLCPWMPVGCGRPRDCKETGTTRPNHGGAAAELQTLSVADPGRWDHAALVGTGSLRTSPRPLLSTRTAHPFNPTTYASGPLHLHLPFPPPGAFQAIQHAYGLDPPRQRPAGNQPHLVKHSSSARPQVAGGAKSIGSPSPMPTSL